MRYQRIVISLRKNCSFVDPRAGEDVNLKKDKETVTTKRIEKAVYFESERSCGPLVWRVPAGSSVTFNSTDLFERKETVITHVYTYSQTAVSSYKEDCLCCFKYKLDLQHVYKFLLLNVAF